jgi:hypothetical protein
LPEWALVRDPVPGDERRHLEYQPPLESLFTPAWTRAMLAVFCATEVAEGPIDFGRIIEDLCRRRPVAALPRQPVWTMRRGIQLLVDESDGFSFYSRDAADLVDELESVAGRDRTEALRFTGAPLRGVRAGRYGTQRRWRAPSAGTPILVVSDFGLSRGARMRGGASIAEWEAFARQARAAGCPLLGIVPIGPARWPAALRKVIRLLRWDRAATVALARRLARRELT